jgi:hypothetical protein
MKLLWLAGTGRTKFEFHRPSSCRSLWLNSNLTDLEIECTYYSRHRVASHHLLSQRKFLLTHLSLI